MSPPPLENSSGLAGFLRVNWWKLAILLLYCALLAYMISVHEPWYDELQAWLLARDANPLTLFWKYMRYDGHPWLWHLTLMIPAKLGLPPFTMNLISGIIATISVYLLLFRSRFPVVLKVLLPFSYFLFYQFAVVARNYCLITLLLFLIAMVFPQRDLKFYTYVFLLCLLANVSIHGTLIASSLLFVHWVFLRKEWSALDRRAKRKQLIGTAVFLMLLALLIIMMWPPSDLSWPPETGQRLSVGPRVSQRVLNHSLTGIWWISLAALLIICAWLYGERLLFLYLVCLVPLLLFLSLYIAKLWQEGIAFLVLIFVMWLGFDGARDGEGAVRWRPGPGPRRGLRLAATVALVVVLLFQVWWSIGAFRHDSELRYSTVQDVVDYIKRNHLEGKKIAMLGIQVGVLAYFKENIFYNYNDGQKPSFWVNSISNEHVVAPSTKDIQKVAEEKPEYIIAPYNIEQIPGYRPVAVFWSDTIWKDKATPPGPDPTVIYKRI
jgi:hypothetical protein